MTDSFTTTVVGVTFCPGYPESILDLRALCEERGELQNMEPVPAVLIRNPDNPADPNAVEVHVPAVGHQIGHLDRWWAKRLAPSLDAGEGWLCEVVSIRVHPAHRDRPGIDVRLRRPEQ